MHSSDPQLKQKNAEWHAKMSPRKPIAQHSHSALKVMHFMFFSQKGLVLDQSIPIGKMVNSQYYCTLLQFKVSTTVNNQNCLSMVLVCFIKIQHLVNNMMCKTWYNVGGGRYWQILLILQILPHVIHGCLHM